MCDTRKKEINWFKWGIYFSALFLSVLVFLEIACRFGYPSSQHYRIRRVLQSKDDYKSRVMVIGDSFSLDFENMFGFFLKRHFNSRNISVLNLAKSGYGPVDYLAALKQYGPEYQPDLIVLNYYVGNDLTDSLRTNRNTDNWKESLKKIIRLSYLGALFLEIRTARSVLSEIEQLKQRHEEALNKVDLRNIYLLEIAKAYPTFLIDNLLIDSQSALQLWEKNKEILMRINELAQSLDGQLIINIFPSTLQIDTTHVEFYKQLGFNTSDTLITSEVPQALLGDFCKRNDIQCFDLLPYFKKNSNEQFYLLNDDHLNKKGNQVAFELIKNELELRKLIEYEDFS